MAKQHISIKISGTPVRKGGFIPIVNINDAFFDIHDAYPVALTRDACLYSVTVMPDITVYKLVFNRMRHHDDDAAARLVIAFSMPAGYRLPKGKDPAGVLHTLLEAFVGSFAFARPDGSFEYRFGRLDTSMLEEISESIKLVPSDNDRAVMKESDPRGALEVSGERIAKTLEDAESICPPGISELLVGEHINKTLAGIAVSVGVPDDEPTPGSIYADEQRELDSAMAGADIGADYVNDIDISMAQPVASDDMAGASAIMPDDGNIPAEMPSYDLADQHSFVTQDNYDDTRAPRHRKMWIPLLVGILVGACAASAIVGILLSQKAEQAAPAALMAVGVEEAEADAAAPVETVFVEKKVIVEVAPQKPVTRRVPVAPLNEPSSLSPATDPETPPQVSQPPKLKYDPEVERSL